MYKRVHSDPRPPQRTTRPSTSQFLHTLVPLYADSPANMSFPLDIIPAMDEQVAQHKKAEVERKKREERLAGEELERIREWQEHVDPGKFSYIVK